MELQILAVGRGREEAVTALVERYRRRCPWVLRLREVTPRAAAPPNQAEAEARSLLAAAPEGAVVVALDERGRDLSSEELAAQLGRWRDEGRRAVAFLIGGPDGLGTAALEAATLVLAMGRMTWPHELARAMLAEQLYRATMILAGHPYHRG